MLKPVSKLVDSVLLDFSAFLNLPVIGLAVPKMALEFSVVEGSLVH